MKGIVSKYGDIRHSLYITIVFQRVHPKSADELKQKINGPGRKPHVAEDTNVPIDELLKKPHEKTKKYDRNDHRQVKITDATDFDLFGELV